MTEQSPRARNFRFGVFRIEVQGKHDGDRWLISVASPTEGLTEAEANQTREALEHFYGKQMNYRVVPV